MMTLKEHRSKKRGHFLVAALSLSLAAIAASQPTGSDELPPDGIPLVAPAGLTPNQLRVRLGNGNFATSQIQSNLDHPAFDQSLKIRITQRPPQTWDIAVSAPTTAPVKKDDAILVGFWARGRAADGIGGGIAEFVFERHGPPHTKSVQYLVETPANGDWKHFWIRCLSLEDYAPGDALVLFQSGYTETTFELAGLEAWNFGDKLPLDQLPHTPLTYAGRDSTAPWRAEAAKRIDQHRKAGLTVTVLDKDGKPRPNLPVHVRLDRHAFDFGTAVKANLILDEGPDADRYRETLLNYFNLAVIENGLKWRMWDARPVNQPKTLEALQWLADQNMPVRGHVMVWPGYRHLPPWIKSLEDDPEILTKVINTHIREIGYAAGHHVRDWDVLNEVHSNRDLTNTLGDEAMIEWFQVAKAVAPHAKRYYNDYAALVRGGFPTAHKDHFENTLRYLIDEGAPIDGIGIQGHFGSLLTPPKRLYEELNRWADLDLGILITEYDVTVPDPKLQADFTRDFLTICFSHPAVDGVVTWGFWADAQWKPESALFTKDWEPTPMGRQWIDLTTRTWHTDETITTDDRGQIQLRAFLGNYTLTAAGTTKSFLHQKPASTITLTLHQRPE